jgi:hypothetical protein
MSMSRICCISWAKALEWAWADSQPESEPILSLRRSREFRDRYRRDSIKEFSTSKPRIQTDTNRHRQTDRQTDEFIRFINPPLFLHMYLSIPWNLSIDEPFSSRGSFFGDRGAVFIWHLGDRGAVLTIAEMDSLSPGASALWVLSKI